MLHMRAMKPAPNQAAAGQPPPKSLNEQASEASKPQQEVARPHDDTDLVSRVQRGDEVAFRTLYDRYNRRAFAVAFGVVKNQSDALDVVQEAFIKVHKHIGNFHGASTSIKCAARAR